MKMPPLARNEIDTNGMRLLREWIESLPGPPVLPPPAVSPPGGNYRQKADGDANKRVRRDHPLHGGRHDPDDK